MVAIYNDMDKATDANRADDEGVHMTLAELEIDQDWRSIIRDACNLRDLCSYGDELKGYRYVILGKLDRRSPPTEARDKSRIHDKATMRALGSR